MPSLLSVRAPSVRCGYNVMQFVFRTIVFIMLGVVSLTHAGTLQNTVESYLQKHQAAGDKANRLIEQSSPYLLQHAYNPVNWFAWGEEAFELARKQDKPIFLSIGYSTCHWCHVMAHESFENKQIADILNRYFISIKVDREERPDIDNVYMSATQLINGHGGWPMTVFLDHDLQPFHAGTYYPPDDRDGHTGLKQLLTRVNDLWQQDRSQIHKVAKSVTATLMQQADETQEEVALDKNIIAVALNEIAASFDDDYGGFGSAPKFPRPGIFQLLLEQADKNKTALAMMRTTLGAMSRGGIHDQLGGGFHRYSVDAEWQVPHFEKMLYSQALMSMAYGKLYTITQDKYWLDVMTTTLDFVLREMRQRDGVFYSALDADSETFDENHNGTGEKKEGAYYLWSAQQIKQRLSPQEWEVVRQVYNIESDGNIVSDPSGEFEHSNILYIYEDAPTLNTQQRELLQSAKSELLASRTKRPRPHLDDKVITAWNGMVIKALVDAAALLKDDPGEAKRYLSAAIRAAEVIEDRLMDKQSGELYRRLRGQVSGVTASLDDYVWFTNALLALYEYEHDKRWLQLAIKITQRQIALFSDERRGGFYESASDESLLFRSRSAYDGALPSPNAIAMDNLLRLSSATQDKTWRKYYDRSVSAFSASINASPASAAWMLAIIAAE